MNLEWIGVGVVVAVAVGCGDTNVTTDPPDQCEHVNKDVPVEINRMIDILFVVDTSSSMADEQASLTTNFVRFVNVMENVEGGLPDVHIGVVSADLGAGGHAVSGCVGGGDDGRLQTAPQVTGCMPPTDAFISDTEQRDGVRVRNYDGSLADALSCIALLGAEGCDIPRPLEAMRRALDGTHAANSGFLREHAFLMVVFITDSDDCSVTDDGLYDPAATALGPASEFRCFEHGVECTPDDPRTPGTKVACVPRADSSHVADVDSYVQFLKGLKEDPNMVMVSAITGGTDTVSVSTGSSGDPELAPACTSTSGTAGPSPRFAYFLDQFPQRSTFTSMCSEDLSEAFLLIAQSLAKVLGLPCIDGAIDQDPETDGIQHECVVAEIQYDGAAIVDERVIPECDTPDPQPGVGDLPCWRLVTEPNWCEDAESGAWLELVRAGSYVPPGTIVRLQCLGRCETEPAPAQ